MQILKLVLLRLVTRCRLILLNLKLLVGRLMRKLSLEFRAPLAFLVVYAFLGGLVGVG